MTKEILVSNSHPVIVVEEYFDWLSQFEWFVYDGLPAMSLGKGRIAHMETLIRARENPRMGCFFDRKGVLKLKDVPFDYLISIGAQK